MEHVEGSRHLEDPVRGVDLGEAASNAWSLLSETSRGNTAHTLVKRNGMKVVMLVMKGGSSIPDHRTDADITVQVLRGRICFRVAGEARLLERGRLIAVARELKHDLEALEDSELLLTLSSNGGRHV